MATKRGAVPESTTGHDRQRRIRKSPKRRRDIVDRDHLPGQYDSLDPIRAVRFHSPTLGLGDSPYYLATGQPDVLNHLVGLCSITNDDPSLAR